MEMDELMELLKERLEGRSNEQFANEIGLRGSTMWRYRHGQSDINTQARKKMLLHFAAANDEEMVGALLIYKSGTSLGRAELKQLGRHFLGLSKNDNTQAVASS